MYALIWMSWLMHSLLLILSFKASTGRSCSHNTRLQAMPPPRFARRAATAGLRCDRGRHRRGQLNVLNRAAALQLGGGADRCLLIAWLRGRRDAAVTAVKVTLQNFQIDSRIKLGMSSNRCCSKHGAESMSFLERCKLQRGLRLGKVMEFGLDQRTRSRLSRSWSKPL